MMAPLFKYGYFGYDLMIVLAIASGIAFGFITSSDEVPAGSLVADGSSFRQKSLSLKKKK